jgi:hypothetical protein
MELVAKMPLSLSCPPLSNGVFGISNVHVFPVFRTYRVFNVVKSPQFGHLLLDMDFHVFGFLSSKHFTM